MANVETIARAALGDLAVDQNHLLNGQRWVNDRYAEFAGTVRLRQLRRIAGLTIPAVLTTGTVSLTTNSTIVTGNVTAVAAWSLSLEGRFFQIDRIWYRIVQVLLPLNQLILDTPYAGATAATQTYRIVSRYSLLAPDARTVVGFIHDRWNRRIDQYSLSWLDLKAPERWYQVGGPSCAVDIGEDVATRRKQIEFYPYSTDAEHIRYAYYAVPPRLELDDDVPAGVDQDALKEGVLIDVMRWKMAKAADEGKTEVAVLWRNEYRAQETKWKSVLQRLVRADTAIEDLAWMTRAANGLGRSDITTARDEVWARGRRP